MEIKEIFDLGELFERVQMEQIYPDGKTFPDCTPLMHLTRIKDLYEDQKKTADFNLYEFVKKYFLPPENNTIHLANKESLPLIQHLESLWDELTREPDVSNNSLISLPNKYIIPGGRFREIYYWDSYFTMLGLEVSGKIDIIQSMIENFAFLIDHIGYIPNGNRTYYLGRSQPPFFACMVQLLSNIRGNQILLKLTPQLIKEYSFWMKPEVVDDKLRIIYSRVTLLPDGSVMNHYSDEFGTPRPESFKEDHEIASLSEDPKIRCRELRAGAESGWDFSSRWFRDQEHLSEIHTTEIIPVDLNCLLYNLEQTIAKSYKLAGDDILFNKFNASALKRKNAINNYCWNETAGYFFDFDHIAGKQKTSLTLAGCYPMFFEICTTEQATLIAKVVEEKFLYHGGLVTSRQITGQQWDAPNGWAPLQWIVIKGLLNYGFNLLAKDIATRWMSLNEKVYKSTGKMMEKYNVQDTSLLAGGGEYPAQDGFGWTNGVYLKLHSLFKSQNK